MLRRPLLAVGALVAALILSSCSAVSSNNDVASVGDASLDRSTFEQYMREVLEINDPGGDHSDMSADIARRAITQWVVEELSRQYLTEQGVEITETDRSAAEAQLDQQLATYEEATVSDPIREFLIDSVAVQMVFQNTQEAGAVGAFAAGVDVSVDSRYGYWDGTTGNVVAFG